MWLFTKHGFFSIVQDKDDEDYLLVRSRVKGDIESLIEDYSDYKSRARDLAVQETKNSDYRYRIRLSRKTASDLLAKAILDIDYTNYKAAVHMVDQRRSEYYGMIWAIMADMQDNLLNEE